jgi:hypothetical protein
VPDPAGTSAGLEVSNVGAALPADPTASPAAVDGGFAGEVPIDLAAVGAAVGSLEGRLLLTSAVMAVVTARISGVDWGMAPMLNSCGLSVRMSFEAMRLVPCRSAQAVRSVTSPALRGFTSGTNRGSDVDATSRTSRDAATSSAIALQSPDLKRAGVLGAVRVANWPVPLRDTALLRLFAVIVATASAVMALVAGMKDEFEQRRRHQYWGRLHS